MSRTEALKITCPKCGAPPRMPCMGRRGARASCHAGRHQNPWNGYKAPNVGVRESRCDKPGWVYLIGPRGADLIKIGWTQGDPLRRLKQLQTGNGELLCLLGAFSGTRRDEQALHMEFGEHRTTGEWFSGPDVLRGLFAAEAAGIR